MTSVGLGARDHSAAIGFAANVAARIQGVARPGTVVVSDAGRRPGRAVLRARAHRDGAAAGRVGRRAGLRGQPGRGARSTIGDDRLADSPGRAQCSDGEDRAAWEAAKSAGGDDRIIVLVGGARDRQEPPRPARDGAGPTPMPQPDRDQLRVETSATSGLGAVRRADRARRCELGGRASRRSGCASSRSPRRGRGPRPRAPWRLLEALLGDVSVGLRGPSSRRIVSARRSSPRCSSGSRPRRSRRPSHWWSRTCTGPTTPPSRRSGGSRSAPLPPGLFVLLTARSRRDPRTPRGHLLKPPSSSRRSTGTTRLAGPRLRRPRAARRRRDRRPGRRGDGVPCSPSTS